MGAVVFCSMGMVLGGIIKDGDWIWIETPKGRITQKAKITDEIHPKCVRAKNFWWYPEKPGPDHGCFDSNFNVLTSIDGPYDPILGNTRLRGLDCRIRKAEGHSNF